MVEGMEDKDKQADEQWGSATACGSGDPHPPRDEDELQDMRSMWKGVLEREGKLSASATRATDAGGRSDPGTGG